MNKLLDKIKSPKDFRKFSESRLKQLAQEVRNTILDHVSQKGGHFSSNLGTIELTIALHKVFNTPEDKLIWDVGHQAYPHKILTGRYKNFYTLKQPNGLSGFLKRSESPYDCFGAGHASTSFAAAMGFSNAFKHQKKKNKVVAVIGDGSLTGGMAYEALNNAGYEKSNIIFILNDNRMSIAPNVGSISKYLNRIISNPLYSKIKTEVLHITGLFPGIGKNIVDFSQKIEHSLKNLILPGSLFEDLGIRYYGPIDGHNIKELVNIFNKLKNHQGPCLIHVNTQKGQGWKNAEKDSYKWHAATPFDLETGIVKQPVFGKSYGKLFSEVIIQIAKKDKKVIAITAAMPDGTNLKNMQEALPKQVYDVGIAEPYAVTFAGGLACESMKPVVAIYSTFLQRAIDQIIHDIALQNLNVIFALSHGGLVGADGPTHHGVMDITYLRMIPNLVIMAPSSGQDLNDMLHFAYKYDKGPIAVRYPKSNIPETGKIKTKPNNIRLGQVKVLTKGTDKRAVLLLAVGHMLNYAKEAQEKLNALNISSTLVDVRFIKPLDKIQYKKLFRQHQSIITIEDNVINGGFGSGISELLSQLEIYNLPIQHLGIPDTFVTHGSIPELHKEFKMDASAIVKSVQKMVKKINV